MPWCLHRNSCRHRRYNVIADLQVSGIRTSLIVSRHLDSWTLGTTAAIDDGAHRVVLAMHTVHLLRKLVFHPSRTIRCHRLDE